MYTMKPRLTIAVRRGLADMASLAGADVDADRASECPQFTGRRLRDFDAAQRWIACLDREPLPRADWIADMNEKMKRAQDA